MSVLSGMPSPSLSSPKISVWITSRSCAAVVGEVLLDAHGAALEGHDRQQIRRLHLRVDELLRARRRRASDRPGGIAVRSK